MTPRSHRLSAWDGGALHVLEWNPDAPGLPLLCLPGLVRTGWDFAPLASGAAAGRRIVAVDYAGRGGSFRVPSRADLNRYGAEACLRDLLDIAAALGLHRAVVVGTSFGGLLAMGLAVARPGLLAGVVLNDIGPEIGTEGAAFVRRFVAHDPAAPDLGACIAHLRATLPPLSIEGEAAWATMARLTYAPGADGRWHPLWDTRIARLLDEPAPDMWPLFGALAPIPLLVLRGALSNILSAPTLARMAAAHGAMDSVTIAGVGHAPSLAEPASAAALTAFLARVAAGGAR